MLKSLISLIAPLFTIVLCSCGGNDEPASTQPVTITLSTESLSFSSDESVEQIAITTTGREWDATTSADWIKISKTGTTQTNGSITITASVNTARTERTANVTVVSGTTSKNISVKQDGKTPEPVDTSITVPAGYELVWNDEFSKPGKLNSVDWKHEVQGPGWVNNELQNYVNQAYDGIPVSEIVDGSLLIHTFKHVGKIYSARIYAKENTGWQYGIFEARIKLPKGKGTWPAFWMMPVNNNFTTNPWPRCGEIDIMEEVGYNPNYTSSSIHCDSYNHVIGTQKTAERLTEGAQDEFHIYRLEWTEEYIRTYVDDKMLLNFPNDKKGNIATWPFNKPFYIILNLAWGGSWGGAQGVDDSVLPATMEVDYVRVFQKGL